MNDLFSLKGRVAIVTGGAEKLGYSMAEGLSMAGAAVVLTSRNYEKAACAARIIENRTGNRVLPHALDLADEAAITTFAAWVNEELGRADILINNASGRGISSAEASPSKGHPEAQPLTEWEYTLYHNVTNAFLCCKHFLPLMKAKGRGSIINISSIAALVGRDRSVYEGSPGMVPNTADYSAAKAALIGFTQDLAAQVGASGIRVNAIAAGGFRHPAQPELFVEKYSRRTMLGRMGDPATDLQGAVLYLASDASAYVTAHTLVVDGGFSRFH